VKIALLSYSTKPRGAVVHTLALAEALAEAGEDVTVWTLGRGGDSGFFRLVDPLVRQRIVPFPEREGEGVGPPEGFAPGPPTVVALGESGVRVSIPEVH
jgi:hypothetical protein